MENNLNNITKLETRLRTLWYDVGSIDLDVVKMKNGALVFAIDTALGKRYIFIKCNTYPYHFTYCKSDYSLQEVANNMELFDWIFNIDIIYDHRVCINLNNINLTGHDIDMAIYEVEQFINRYILNKLSCKRQCEQYFQNQIAKDD